MKNTLLLLLALLSLSLPGCLYIGANLADSMGPSNNKTDRWHLKPNQACVDAQGNCYLRLVKQFESGKKTDPIWIRVLPGNDNEKGTHNCYLQELDLFESSPSDNTEHYIAIPDEDGKFNFPFPGAEPAWVHSYLLDLDPESVGVCRQFEWRRDVEYPIFFAIDCILCPPNLFILPFLNL